MKGSKEREMKKNAVGTICCCFFLATPAICFGFGGNLWYGSANAGVALATDSDLKVTGFPTVTIEYDTGYTVGGAIGYMMESFRIEGEVSYQANDVDKVDGLSLDPLSAEASALTFLANGYWHFLAGSSFVPYITAGIGATNIQFEMTGEPDEDDTVWAYQLGVGVLFKLRETLALDCKYRYLGASNAEFTDAEIEVASNNITIGLVMAF
jgi:opacity protein-like surface antigen